MNNNYNRRKPPVKEKKHKTNGEVRFPQVRVTGEIGQGQIMSSYEASKLAESNGKDLILISENANPPVVKIEDYGKFLYEFEKREKENKKNQKKSDVKEISLSANIADHDLSVKSKKALEFLEDGNKVKLTLLLKGRQHNMSQQGQVVMLKFATLVEESGIPEAMPKLEGSKWNMILKPRKK
jgi:translation initiation factor IF-3